MRAQYLSLLIVPGLLLVHSACNKSSADAGKKGVGKKGGESVPVVVAKTQVRNVPLEVQVIGNVEAYSIVSVKSQITGLLEKVHFNEGDYIKKGDLLFSIDQAPFMATLSQMEANVARDRAALEQVKANLSRDQAQLKYQTSQANRYANLFKEGVIAKDAAEQVQTSADTLSHAVNADQAAIQSAVASIAAGEASVRNARIQLSYTTIRSPIDGRTGNITAKEGNLASANVTELVTINQVQPVYVTFAVPEGQLTQIKGFLAQGKVSVNAAPPDDPVHPETGTLTFVDNRVDATTGTIRLKATFPNVGRKLWPGQFVRVSMRLSTVMNAVLVPNQAVQTGQDGPYVYRVRPDMTVEMAKIVVGGRVEQDIVVQSGLQPDDTVVSEGQLRLAPNMKVRLRESTGAPAGGDRGKGKTKE